MSINKAILIGRLGAKPEKRQTNSGSSVATLSLATSDNYTDKSGQRQERTEWHRVVLWARLADIAEQYLDKGSQIYIEGRIQTREWQDKDGNKRYTTEIIGTQMKFLDSRSSQSGGGDQSGGGYGQGQGGGYGQGGGGYGQGGGGYGQSGGSSSHYGSPGAQPSQPPQPGSGSQPAGNDDFIEDDVPF